MRIIEFPVSSLYTNSFISSKQENRDVDIKLHHANKLDLYQAHVSNVLLGKWVLLVFLMIA